MKILDMMIGYTKRPRVPMTRSPHYWRAGCRGIGRERTRRTGGLSMDELIGMM